jgi:TPR repeat protein
MELINAEFKSLDIQGIHCQIWEGEPTERVQNVQEYFLYESLISGVRNNDANLIFQLARCYEFGSVFSSENNSHRIILIKPIVETAIALYKMAYSYGSSDAANQLGMMYHHGVNFNSDLEMAKEMFRFAASKNNVNALYILGVYSIQENDYQAGYEYFLKAADLGHVLACYNVALALHKGEIVWEKNDPMALYYAKVALDQMPDNENFKLLFDRIYKEIV